MKRSKKYIEAAKKIDTKKEYSVEEAMKLAKEMSYTSFVGSLDVIMNFKVSAKMKNESIRGSVTLPHQTGDSAKVVVVCEEGLEKDATAAGADKVGGDPLIKEISEGYVDFDVLIATPTMMPKLGRLGQVLGPKGLMPNPKNETVTKDIVRVVTSYKAGKKDFKLNDQGAIKAGVAKLDMTPEQIQENFMAFLNVVAVETKKLGINRFKAIIVSPTMGPGIKIDLSDALKEIV